MKFQSYSVQFFDPDFNLLSCELHNFKVLRWIILHWYFIKVKIFYNTLTVPCDKSKMVSFSTSSRSKFPVKLIYCISFGSRSSACCLLKSIAISL